MKCKLCGQTRNVEYGGPEGRVIKERGVCFTCAFWINIIESPEEMLSRETVINGTAYAVVPDTAFGMKGYGGQRFYIRYKDGREIVTHNLWCRGEIPIHFKAQLPDTAQFINPPGYHNGAKQ